MLLNCYQVKDMTLSKPILKMMQLKIPATSTRRELAGVVTHCKVGYKVGKALVIQHPNDFKVTARLEVDSRAITCCFGKTFRLLEQSDREADVQGFSGELVSFSDVPIGTAWATAIDLTGVQETIIGVWNEGLYFDKHLDNSLLNPTSANKNYHISMMHHRIVII